MTKYRIFAYTTIGALIVSMIFGGIRWYGSNQYKAGYKQAGIEYIAASAKVSEEYRKKEAADRKKAEEEYAKYQAEQAKTAAARDRLANLYSSLQHDYAEYKRSVSRAASDPERATRAINAGIDNIEQCTKRYTDMAKEYAGRSDQLNGLIAQCK